MKLNKTLIIISLLLIFCISLGAVSATNLDISGTDTNLSATNDITTINQDIKVNEVNKTFADIQQMIDDAEMESEIKLNGTYFGNGTEIIVNKSLIISGNAILDANGKSNIFNIISDSVVIKDLEITNGGIIWTSEIGGSLINCNVSNGKGVSFNGVGGYISNCIFSNNTKDFGGAVCGNDLIIENSIFNNNQAIPVIIYRNLSEEEFDYKGGSGGAICSRSNLKCINCEFNNNQAIAKLSPYSEYTTGGLGGAIAVEPNLDVNLFFENCTFNNNHADVAGGAIGAGDSETLDNYINSFEVKGCKFTSNKVKSNFDIILGGGAIFLITPKTAYVSDSTFIYNYAEGNWTTEEGYLGAQGGAIYIIGSLSCKNSNLSNNYASFSGGAICIESLNNLYSTIYNCYLSQNKADQYGGAIAIIANAKISECNIIDNTAEFGQIFYDYSQFNVIYNNNYWGDEYSPTLEDLEKFTDDYNVIFVEDEFYSAVPSTWYNENTKFNPEKQTYFDLSLKTSKGTYADGKSCYVNMINGNGPGKGEQITFKAYKSGKLVNSGTVTLNSNGIGYLPFYLSVGTYTIVAYYPDANYTVKKSYTVSKAKGTLSASKSLTVTYNSGKKLSIKLINSVTKNPVKSQKLTITVYKGSKKYKTYYVTTNSKGYAYFDTDNLVKGKFTIYISCSNSNIVASKIKSTITVNKGTTIVTAPTVTNKYKENAYFKVTIKNKASGKLISGLTLKIKVYTGSKYITYTVKTNSNGVASLNTKALSKGNHKVVITSGNDNYLVSKSGNLIKIV